MKPRPLEYRVDEATGCHIVTSHKPTEYGYIRFWVNGKSVRAHRWVYEQEHGPLPDDILVCHTCDLRSCINLEHLFEGTAADNARDRDNKGRAGDATAKLTPEQAIYVREHTEINGAAMARKMGVSRNLVRNIRHRIHWAHLA